MLGSGIVKIVLVGLQDKWLNAAKTLSIPLFHCDELFECFNQCELRAERVKLFIFISLHFANV